MTQKTNGNIIAIEEENVKRWCEHLESILNGSTPNEVRTLEGFTGKSL